MASNENKGNPPCYLYNLNAEDETEAIRKGGDYIMAGEILDELLDEAFTLQNNIGVDSEYSDDDDFISGSEDWESIINSSAEN